MNTQQTTRHRDYGFVLGMLTGTVVGAGLGVWLSPRFTTDMRQRVVDAANDLVKKGNGMRDDVANAVAHGAHEVERVALAARSARR